MENIVTAFIDNEIHDPVKKKEILLSLEKNPNLKFDFNAQSLIKNLVKEKIGFKETPAELKKKIIKKLKSFG